MSNPLARRSIDALFTPPKAAPQPRTGELVLTHGQKIALLKMRGNDWSKAVLKHLKAFGQDAVAGADYYACARLGLAEHKGSYHVLTDRGRRRADGVAAELAREAGLHVITYGNLIGRGTTAAFARCTCGWSAHRTRAIPSYAVLIGRDVQHHLEHVGAQP